MSGEISVAGAGDGAGDAAAASAVIIQLYIIVKQLGTFSGRFECMLDFQS